MAFTVLKPSNVFCLLILLLVLHSPTSCKADNVVLHSPLHCRDNNILYSGETLYSCPVEEYLECGSYRLVMRNNCDLTLYDDGNLVWSSDTSVDTCCYCTLHTNGSLIIYRPNGEPIWRTKASVEGHYVLILQDDGHVVIYGPNIWATITTDENVSHAPAAAVVNNIGGRNAKIWAPKLASVVGAAVN